jgi:proteasome lid subunit RPN8/RPN11
MSITSTDLDHLLITQSVLDAIHSTIGALPAEQGGLLGGRYEDGIVTDFEFDSTAVRSSGTYSPNTQVLNELLENEWNPRGIRLLGFIHSHPPGMASLSPGDLSYAQKILDHIPDLERLLLPLVLPSSSAKGPKIVPFAVTRSEEGVDVKKLDLRVLEESMLNEIIDDTTEELVENADDGHRQPARIISATRWGNLRFRSEYTANATLNLTETFDRVQSAYDIPRLAKSRIIYIGAGGAAQYVEEMARCGVGEHVLIDPDTVSLTNIGTQQVYRRDVGRNKVDCIAERIAEINPEAAINTCAMSLNDIDDDAFELLALKPIGCRPAPEQTLLCGLTDSFAAQARVNRLAIKYRLPSLCAQLYHQGKGAEVTFTHPNVTLACHRCILSPRYEAYLQQRFTNDVTSHGTPIFATTRVNAIKGFLTLAVLHHGSNHPRFGPLLKRIGHRNLVQLRMDPDLDLKVFDRTFGGENPRTLFDEAVWLNQTQNPDCPDCTTGPIHDTRHLPQGSAEAFAQPAALERPTR